MKNAPYYIGVDLHKAVIQICVLGEDGEILEERRFVGGSLEEGLEAVGLVRRYEGARVAVEAVGVNRWFVNALRAVSIDVTVADPVKLNLRMLGKKTDRRDAQEIARRLRLGDIDRYAATYFPTETEYGGRKVLRIRHKLLGIRQRIVNQIRALLNAYRIPAPQGVLYGKRAMAALGEVCELSGDHALCLRVLVDQLSAIQQGVAKLTSRITTLAKNPEIEPLVATLPSVGPQTAATLVYELGDVTRFRNARAVASFAGLAPRVANSADTSHHGAITKRGNSELRWILSEWAVRLMSRNPLAKAWAAARLRRMHKNKVRIALARKLLVGVYVLLSRGESFNLRRCLAS